MKGKLLMVFAELIRPTLHFRTFLRRESLEPFRSPRSRSRTPENGERHPTRCRIEICVSKLFPSDWPKNSVGRERSLNRKRKQCVLSPENKAQLPKLLPGLQKRAPDKCVQARETHEGNVRKPCAHTARIARLPSKLARSEF